MLKRITSVASVHTAAYGRMESGEIYLAPNPSRKSMKPEEDDFLLKVADVQVLTLRARPVVLSCGNSGRGTVSAEGVVGIARASLVSGARSFLATLWAAGDEATMEFMKDFY